MGKTVQEAEALLPDARVFVERIRRGGQIVEATADTIIQPGDIVAVAGRRDVLVNVIGAAAQEVDDRELLAVPVEGVDVYVTSQDGRRENAGRVGDLTRSARRFPAKDNAWGNRN